MHCSTARAALLLAAAAVATTATAGQAATMKRLPPSKPVVAADVTGDANGVNGQNARGPATDVATPVGRASSDITGLELRRKDDGRSVTGIVATLTLAAPPEMATAYYFRLASADCPTITLYLLVYQDGTTESGLEDTCFGDEIEVPVNAQVAGSRIAFDVPRGDLPLPLGTELTTITAATLAMVGANPTVAVHPVSVDELVTDLRWKLGS